jgi:transcriptional regulator with XRE-family HTH domain
MERPSPLRARRILRGKRLLDVARAIGISETVLSRLERGEARLVGPVLRNLARFYSTPPTRLVDEMRTWAARAGGAAEPHDGNLVPPSSAA